MDQQRTMTISDVATPFGCCNYFDSCADEIFSLTYRGALGLLDWLGWNVVKECYRSVEFITFRRPEQSNGQDTAGYQSDPCAEPNSWEMGTRKLTVEDFGRITRAGPTREIVKPEFYCKTRPRYRLDGSRVMSEQEWDLLFTMDQMLDDMRKLIITGNSATPGQFDGLEQWVSTAHGGALNGKVVDWNGNDMSGGAGITFNGAPVSATADLITVLQAVFRQVMQQRSWNPSFSGAPVRLGDMILVLPTFARDCLLDLYTCWSVCSGSNYSTEVLQTYEARNFRNSLISAQNPANLFGHGYITLDGITIPILAHDWELINGPSRFDMYLLTGQVGGRRIWEGEMLDASAALANLEGVAGGAPLGGYFTLDGGRVLGLRDTSNECYKIKLWQHPRLFCLAPWMQIRFEDVACHSAISPLSPDPSETSFYPETSFNPAEC